MTVLSEVKKLLNRVNGKQGALILGSRLKKTLRDACKKALNGGDSFYISFYSNWIDVVYKYALTHKVKLLNTIKELENKRDEIIDETNNDPDGMKAFLRKNRVVHSTGVVIQNVIVGDAPKSFEDYQLEGKYNRLRKFNDGFDEFLKDGVKVIFEDANNLEIDAQAMYIFFAAEGTDADGNIVMPSDGFIFYTDTINVTRGTVIGKKSLTDAERLRYEVYMIDKENIKKTTRDNRKLIVNKGIDAATRAKALRQINDSNSDIANLAVDIPNVVDFKFEVPVSGGATRLVGYRLAIKTNDGDDLSNNTIARLKAYSPCANRKYNETTTASTSESKICIYECYLDLIGKRQLRYARKNKIYRDELNNLLKEEGEAVEASIRSGYLLDSLKLLTKKDNSRIIVTFYRSNVNDDRLEPFIVDNGEFEQLSYEELDKYIGESAMLHYKNHVAPCIIKKYDKDEIKKIEKKNYAMRPEYLMANDINWTRRQLEKRVAELKEKNTNVLGYDIEIYRYIAGKCIAFAICLYGFINEVKIKKRFYGEECVEEFIDYLFEISERKNHKKSRPKGEIKDIKIYGFNNQNFDNFFIFEGIHDRDECEKSVITKNSIKKIEFNNIQIYDLAAYYTGELKSVVKSFELDGLKGVFPYSFVNKDNLYYIGKEPKKQFFNKGDYQVFREEQDKINSKTFDMKEYTLKYCMNDAELAYNIAMKHLDLSIGIVNNRVYNVSDCCTGAGIAIRMHKQVFLNEVIYQSPENIIIEEREGLFGGLTNAFKEYYMSSELKDEHRIINNIRYGDGIRESLSRAEVRKVRKGYRKKALSDIDRYLDVALNYYDINSSYPASMCKPMPYNFQKKTKYNIPIIFTIDKIKNVVPTNLYFCKAEYKGNKKYYIPNILNRVKEGNLIATKISNYGWHWGDEIIRAINDGCHVTVSQENIYKQKAIFKEYAEHFYNMRLIAKSKGREAEVTFYKLLLNSLYGKFAQKPTTKRQIVKDTTEMYKLIGQDNELISFTVMDRHLMVEYDITGSEYAIGKLVRFSSYIAAASRTRLADAFSVMGHENIYYCDTDSIFCTGELPKDMVHSSELGKWKKENKAPILIARFLAPKTYFYRTKQYIDTNKKTGVVEEKTEIVKKAKGVKGKDIAINEYWDLGEGNVEQISQTNPLFKRTFNGVSINDQVRRIKVIKNKRKWETNSSIAFDTIEEWRSNTMKDKEKVIEYILDVDVEEYKDDIKNNNDYEKFEDLVEDIIPNSNLFK